MTIPLFFGLVLILFVVVAVTGYFVVAELGRSTRLPSRPSRGPTRLSSGRERSAGAAVSRS